MTKKQFNDYTNEYTYCETCNRLLPTTNFIYKNIKLNGRASKCKYCDWVNTHGGIPKIDGFSENQIKIAIEFLIFQKSLYVNDLAKDIEIELKDAILLVQSLKIGNRHCYVLSNCDFCGTEIKNTISVYNKNKHLYCSRDCYWNHKPQTMEHGVKSPFYNRIKTNCTYCGKEIEIIPYDYNKENSYGDNHNFCSQECYWNYRSVYYVGEKSISHNRIITDEQREKMREIMIKNSRSGKRFNSKIQLIVNSILDKNNIKYEREYVIKYYAIDNYLVDSGLMIEVMGDYWHTSPLRYNLNKYMINKNQQKGLLHDKQKHTYIKSHNNIEILYLWEYDIINNIDMCEQLILEYIKSDGKLKNYHSFNWNYNKNSLMLNDDLITPYQDMKTENYKHLIIKKIG